MNPAPGLSEQDMLAALNREQLPDPLAGVEYTGDLEADSALELDAVAEGFRERMRREEERTRLAIDSEYWFVLCFRTRADKEQFLRNAKLLPLGDKYLDGYRAAHILGIHLDTE